MRSKALRVCTIALAVFLGLWLVLRWAQPQSTAVASAESTSSADLTDTGSDPSRAHLASLASVIAGVLAFAVIPGRGKRSILTVAQPSHPRVRSRARHNRTAYRRSVDDTLRCPQCGSRMRRNIVASGSHRGHSVWLCPQSPACEDAMRIRRRPTTITHEQSSGMIRKQIALS